jgi:hypothetical protein
MMMRPIICLLLLVGAAPSAYPQFASGGEWKSLSLESGKYMEIVDGQLKLLRGGAVITLHPAQPDQQELRLQAEEIVFTPGPDGSPERAVLAGNVRITHPSGTIRAGHADWNLKSNVAVFTDKPVLTSDMFKEATGDKISLDLSAGAFSATFEGPSRINNLDLTRTGTGTGAAASPAALTEGHVRDWPGLVGKLKEGAAAPGPTPAKQILATLDAQSRQMFQGASVEMLLQNRGEVVKMLNNALRSPRLYSADAWNGIALDAETQALVAAAPTSGADLARLNRQLLQAAFPAEIAG